MKVTVASWYDKKARQEATRVVSISRADPQWVRPNWKIWLFCPSWDLINGWRDGTIDETEYRKRYLADIVDLDEAVAQIKDGDVLCCWEKKGFCHRFIVAQLLEERGIEVERR